MTDRITNMIDQHSDTRLYSPLLRTWLAVARYRNVKMPVDAIPIVRIRAPEANDRAPPDAPGGSAPDGAPGVAALSSVVGFIRPSAPAASSRETASASAPP